MPYWYATFADLREAGITLQAWLDYHKARRAMLFQAERDRETY